MCDPKDGELCLRKVPFRLQTTVVSRFQSAPSSHGIWQALLARLKTAMSLEVVAESVFVVSLELLSEVKGNLWMALSIQALTHKVLNQVRSCQDLSALAGERLLRPLREVGGCAAGA